MTPGEARLHEVTCEDHLVLRVATTALDDGNVRIAAAIYPVGEASASEPRCQLHELDVQRAQRFLESIFASFEYVGCVVRQIDASQIR